MKLNISSSQFERTRSSIRSLSRRKYIPVIMISLAIINANRSLGYGVHRRRFFSADSISHKYVRQSYSRKLYFLLSSIKFDKHYISNHFILSCVILVAVDVSCCPKVGSDRES